MAPTILAMCWSVAKRAQRQMGGFPPELHPLPIRHYPPSPQLPTQLGGLHAQKVISNSGGGVYAGQRYIVVSQAPSLKASRAAPGYSAGGEGAGQEADRQGRQAGAGSRAMKGRWGVGWYIARLVSRGEGWACSGTRMRARMA